MKKGLHEKQLDKEDLYAKELELVFDNYVLFAQTYKGVSKQLTNPIKMKKHADKIYNELAELGVQFNRTIKSFKDNAVPPEDLTEIHKTLIESLNYFEEYNNEFPELILSGNFKRIKNISKRLDLGYKGIKDVFVALEERERKKVHN